MAAEKLETRIRQDQILHAALSVIASDGLARLNVARVARRVGVVPSALYRHFAGKDAILDAVLETVRERLVANARAAREEGGTAIEQLRSLLDRHLALIENHPGLPRLVFSEEVYSGRPNRRAEMFRTLRAYMARIAEVVRDGQRAGDIRDDLEPGAVALMFLGLVQPAAILSHVGGPAFHARREVAKTWHLFVAAIAAR